MLAATVDFLKESDQVFLIMTRPPLRCHPCRLPANANIVFALPLRLNHFPRKSHSFRRIYARGSSPFLLETSHHSVGTGDRSELLCTLLPPQRELNYYPFPKVPTGKFIFYRPTKILEQLFNQLSISKKSFCIPPKSFTYLILIFKLYTCVF